MIFFRHDLGSSGILGQEVSRASSVRNISSSFHLNGLMVMVKQRIQDVGQRPLLPQLNYEILVVDVSNLVQFRGQFEGKVKLASNKLGAQQGKTVPHVGPSPKTVQVVMEYCSHLWPEAAQYQFLPFYRIQHRAARLIDDQALSNLLHPLALHRCFGHSASSTAFFMGNVSRNCLD
nr:uncharacterized protein LOC113392076 [Vanessa tameamea]